MHDWIASTFPEKQILFHDDLIQSGNTNLSLKKREIELINSTSTSIRIEQKCKDAIAALILENYKRKREGEPFIPLFFCLSMEEYYIFPLPKSEEIMTRNGTNRITFQELRRAYKLIAEFQTREDPRLQEIATIAEETFKFVKFLNASKPFSLVEIPAPWASDEWDIAWKRRISSKEKPRKDDELSWREQLKTKTLAFCANNTQS